MILGMNHFTAIAKDPVATLDFYERIIGLKVGPRPDLGFPGAWLYAGDTAVLHLYFERPVPNPPAGVIDHMAFTAKDLKAVKSVFDTSGYPYKLQHRPDGPWQIFCEDPSGAKVELNFSPLESLDQKKVKKPVKMFKGFEFGGASRIRTADLWIMMKKNPHVKKNSSIISYTCNRVSKSI